MDLYKHLLLRGLLTTPEATARLLLDEFHSFFDGLLVPSEVLLNRYEQQRFCNRIRNIWGIEAPDEDILPVLQQIAEGSSSQM
jgi:hypothetical protein